MSEPSPSPARSPAPHDSPPHDGASRGAAALPHPTRRNWLWLTLQFPVRLLFTFWLRYRVRGLKNMPTEGGGLVLANHQSFLDPLLIGLALSRPVSFLARDNLFEVPVVGWILKKTYVMPINRDAASTSSIREAVARMKHGFLVGIFPEGTRSADGTVGEFKPGFVALLRRAKLPVYPVGVAGAIDAMPRGPLRFRPRPVRVVYGRPIPWDELSDLCAAGREEELVMLLRQRVVDCVEEANAWHARGRDDSR